MDEDEVRTVTHISAALLGNEAYLLGSDVATFLRMVALQALDDAHSYVDEGEREAALALGEMAIQLNREADQIDLSLMEITNFPQDAEPEVASG